MLQEDAAAEVHETEMPGNYIFCVVNLLRFACPLSLLLCRVGCPPTKLTTGKHTREEEIMARSDIL